MRYRRRRQDPVPAPLREFVPGEWPPVENECMGHYSCRGLGYEEPCVPRPGEPCGARFYEAVTDPERVAAQRVRDARVRWRQARLSWLGEDHPDYAAEEIRQLVQDP